MDILVLKSGTYFCYAVGGDGCEEATRGLWVKKEGSEVDADALVDLNARGGVILGGKEVFTVATQPARNLLVLHIVERTFEEGDRGRLYAEKDVSGLRHFGGMTEEAKACDISAGAHSGPPEDASGGAIEDHHRVYSTLEMGGGGAVVAGGCGDYARTDRLGQEEAIARFRAALRHDLRGVGDAGDAEAVLRLFVDYCVAPRDQAPSFADLVGPALQDCSQDRIIKVVGESDYVQGERNLTAHRVDVAH